MVHRVLRAALFVSMLLAVWTLARPARAASAPFCDDRGASAIASPPALEAPDDAIQRSAGTACETGEPVLLGATLSRAHRALSPPATTADLALVAKVVVSAPSFVDATWPPERPAGPLANLGTRVERPPRA